jgi:hypothetical protein
MSSKPGIKVTWDSRFSFCEPTVKLFPADVYGSTACNRQWPYTETKGVEVSFSWAAEEALNHILSSTGMPQSITFCSPRGTERSLTLDQLGKMVKREPFWYHRADCPELWQLVKY